ncbi:hypothetical protein GALL_453100 [mine drainage metagenome]|uniref:NAD-specific glutamate dehydrogenase n=1 Tax=mine drainage metagenome TaxID=410659 RepID=A0A1J5PPH7_9ZZZZ
MFPTGPVPFGAAVFDRQDRVVVHQRRKIGHVFFRAEGFAFAGHYIFAALVVFGRGAIEREADILARTVACLFDGFQNEIKRIAGGAEVGGEAALVADRGGEACGRKLFLKRVEDFGAHADRLADVVRADRHDHEFLNVDRVVGMFAAVDDVHHRQRQDARRGAADVAVERLRGEIGGGFGHGERDAQNGVGAKAALVRGAVDFAHHAVDGDLLGRVKAHDLVRDLAVNGGNCLQHALAHVARLVAVALFHRFAAAGRGARGHRGAAHGAVFKDNVHLDGGVAAAVEDFAGVDVYDRAHHLSFRVNGTP